MSVVAVRHTLNSADRLPVAGRTVTAELIAPALFLADHTGSIVVAAVARSNTAGFVELKLTPQLEIAASGTHYAIRVDGTPLVWHCVVPTSGPVQLAEILVDPTTLNPVAAGTASLFLPRAERGVPNGVAPLGGDGKVPTENLPAGSGGDLDADLVAIGALVPSDNDVIQRKAGSWTNRSPSQLKADLALVTGDITGFAAAVAVLVDAAIAALVDAAPGTLDTLNEIAAAIGDDPNFVTTLTNLIAGKQPVDADLTAIAGLTPTASDLLQYVSGAWANRTPTQVKTSLGLAKSDVGLSNVDNTSDADKPVSTAAQTALNGKVSLSLVDAPGDLLVGSGADALTRLAKGSDGQALGIVGGAVAWVTPSGGGLQVDPIAARYGCLALTMHPHAISWTTPQYIALTSGRHTMYWVPLPAGQLVTGVRLPVQLAGSGAGELHFAVYNDDNSQLGVTGNVAAQFSGAVSGTWQNVPLTAAAASTGDGVWITTLSTMDTGPMVVFSNTSNLPEWLLNPASHLTALRREGVSAPPATLVPNTAIPYIDFAIGVY